MEIPERNDEERGKSEEGREGGREGGKKESSTNKTYLLLSRLILSRGLPGRTPSKHPSPSSSSSSSSSPFLLLPLQRSARMGKISERGVGVLELKEEPEEDIRKDDLELHLQVPEGGREGGREGWMDGEL